MPTGITMGIAAVSIDSSDPYYAIALTPITSYCQHRSIIMEKKWVDFRTGCCQDTIIDAP